MDPQPQEHAIPSPSAVGSQLNKILSSDAFVHSPQLCRFLRFVVEQEVAGKGAQLKEYILGVQVLRKDESFDPRIDTAVRTEARRLRQKLAEYYQAEGRNDSMEIALPKGSYRAVFRARPGSDSPTAIAPSPSRRVPRIWIVAVTALTLLAVAAWWFRVAFTAKPHLPSIAIIPL